MSQEDEADIRQPASDIGEQPKFALPDDNAPDSDAPDSDAPDANAPTTEGDPDIIMFVESEAEAGPQAAIAQAEAGGEIGVSGGETTDARAEAAEPRKEPRRLSRADRDALDRQQRRFVACGRCGYFVADCRIKLGEEAYQAAVLDSRDGWIRLEGDHAIHRMAMGAYGVDLDAEFDLFDGSCPECRRRFVISNDEDGRTRLKIRA